MKMDDLRRSLVSIDPQDEIVEKLRFNWMSFFLLFSIGAVRSRSFAKVNRECMEKKDGHDVRALHA